MSSYGQESNHNPRPLNAVLDAYEQCIRARQSYLQASSMGYGDDALDLIHRNLNLAVMNYYEVLYYELANENLVQEYWEETPLWAEEQFQTDQYGNILYDENGYPVVEEVEVCGLKRLEYQYHQTEVVEEEVSDSFGKRKIRREEKSRLTVDVLFRIARLLDQAAADLNLLVDSDDPVAGLEEAEV